MWPLGGAAAQTQVPECGDTPLQVLPGARMPVDGLVLSGRSHADESMLTGEAEPMLKAEGDAVIGGTMNLGGSLQVCHSCAFSNVFLRTSAVLPYLQVHGVASSVLDHPL